MLNNYIKKNRTQDVIKSKKEIVLDALRKKKGSYASPEAEGSWASPRGRIIRALKEEGKITASGRYRLWKEMWFIAYLGITTQ